MLKIENLTKHYARKTTTLKAVCGIHGFEAGEIYIDGISMREAPLACKRAFAYIPDNPDLAESIMCVLLWVGTAFLYQHNNKTKLENL